MELEEGELMEDAAAAGPSGTEAKEDAQAVLSSLFSSLIVSYFNICQPLVYMASGIGSAIL